jgi:acetophenone carboxylase
MCHNSSNSINSNLGCNAKINANQGLFGGYPGAIPYVARMLDTDFLKKKDIGKIPYNIDEIPELLEGQFIPGPPFLSALSVKDGDILIHTAQGGAGLGDPIERDPELIINDIKDGMATIEISEKVYCVAINRNTLEIDYEETSKLREAKRLERIKKGIPAKDYVKEMINKREKGNLPSVVLNFLNRKRSKTYRKSSGKRDTS